MLPCKHRAVTQATHVKFAYLILHVLFIPVPPRLYFAFLNCEEFVALKRTVLLYNVVQCKFGERSLCLALRIIWPLCTKG